MNTDGPIANASPDLVAIDLGSNSFHMIIARIIDGQLIVIDRLRDRVQLGAGLDDKDKLSAAAISRGLKCLARFEQRMRTLTNARVRAVGTNSLRKATNARDFIAEARGVLGHNVEVISGREEARLIYLGVAHALADDPGRRLVVDIGGGSTECIVGERFEARRTESLRMGCINYTQQFFGDGRVTRSTFRDAVSAAQVELEPLKTDYQSLGWVTAVGASGTISAVDQILRANGWSDDGITLAGLRHLRDALLEQGRVDRFALEGLSTDRAPVIIGGLAILYGVFKSLQIERMSVSRGALREGVLYDSLGTTPQQDIRARTIERLTHLHQIDRDHALRVEATALEFLDKVAHAWNLHHPDHKLLLSWAARLHELGRVVSFSGFHTHGAYILEHSDMAGFARDKQAYLAALVAAHRRRLGPERIERLRAAGGKTALQLAALLRLAATLHRGRGPDPLPPFELVAAGDNLELTMPSAWLATRPLTVSDLQSQSAALRAVDLNFTAR